MPQLNVIIKQVFPVVSGVSQQTGREWRKMEVKADILEDKYGNFVYFSILGDKINALNPTEGAVVTISFDVTSREYAAKDGTIRHSTDITVYRMEPYAASTAAAPGQFAQPAPQQPAYQPQQQYAPQPAQNPFAPQYPPQQAIPGQMPGYGGQQYNGFGQ